MNTDIQNLSYVISFAILNDKNSLINFLLSNSVPVKESVTNEELTAIVVNSLAGNPKIQQNFITWIKEKSSGGYSNSIGSSVLSGATSSTTTSGSGFWSGFDAGAVTGLLSSGLGIFGSLTASKEQRKAIEAQANAQLAAAQAQAGSDSTQLEIAKLQLLAAQGKPSSNNTVLIIVGVVVGLGILGGVIYAVTRKK
jgi:hypothetical protein